MDAKNTKDAEAFAEREYAQKQKGQKPTWTEEDEMEIQRVIALLEGWLSTFIRYAEDCKGGIAWLKSIKQRIGG